MTPKPKILIVEDERELAESLSYYLQQQGFETTVASSGQSALALCVRDRPDIVVLDIGLPDIPGTEVCRRMKDERQLRDVPVVFLTARDSEMDRVVGFELGATDYVVKPFSMRELSLRLRGILRRLHTSEQPMVLEMGPVRVDLARFRATVDGAAVSLTRQELRLLAILVEGNGCVFTRGELLEHLKGEDTEVLERTVDAHVKSLRAKLGPARQLVETVHGVGYRIRRERPLSKEVSPHENVS